MLRSAQSRTEFRSITLFGKTMYRFLLALIIVFFSGCRTTPKYEFSSPVTVVVRFTINEKGTTENIHIMSDSPKEFNVAVINKVKTWHFKPEIKNGIPIKRTVECPVTFTPEKNSGKVAELR